MPGVLPTPLLTTGGDGMAFTVTARHTGSNGTTGSQTLTTDSQTPTASSLFLLAAGVENASQTTLPAWQTPTGGGLAYTSIASIGDATPILWNGFTDFLISSILWRAPVGGSPSAFTATVDGYTSTDLGYYRAVGFDITGHNPVSPIVQSKAAGAQKAGGNTETGTVTFDAAATAGNLIVVMFFAGSDSGGGYASPTAGGGKTFSTVINQDITFCSIGIFYRVADGGESTTITCSDLGQVTGNYTAIAVEVASAAVKIPQPVSQYTGFY